MDTPNAARRRAAPVASTMASALSTRPAPSDEYGGGSREVSKRRVNTTLAQPTVPRLTLND